MILECPACSAKFKIPDGALGTTGRTVRCGKCAHNWKALPEGVAPEVAAQQAVGAAQIQSDQVMSADAPEDTAEQPKPQAAPDIDAVMAGLVHKTNQDSPKQKAKSAVDDAVPFGDYKPPVPVKRKKLTLALYWATNAVLCVVIVCLWSVTERPQWWGIVPSNGLAFESLKLEPMAQIGGNRFTMNPLFKISGTVRNISDKPKGLPSIRVTLKNTDNKPVYDRYYRDKKLIPAGEKVEFTFENLEQAERRHTRFSVEMGNALELALRHVDMTNEY